MAQVVKVYGIAAEPLKLRTATSFRYVVIVGHWNSDKAVKLASSDSPDRALSKLSRALRTDWQGSRGVVVDLATGELVAERHGPRASSAGSLQVRVTGKRGR